MPARKDVILGTEALSAGRRLTKAAFEQLRVEFPEQNLKKIFVLHQLELFREQKAEGKTMTEIQWSRQRKL